MQIAQSKTREQFPLSPKKIIKKTISSTIGWAIFLGVIATFILNITLNFTIRSAYNVHNPSCFYSTELYAKPVCPYIISLGTVVIGYFVVLFLIIILQYFYQRWYFAVYFYDLTSDFIQIKKGPITPAEITIPYERLQDVYVDQDLLDRMFGLYDVHISSATAASGLEAHIDGVEKPAADGLRAILLQTIKERISRNRV